MLRATVFPGKIFVHFFDIDDPIKKDLQVVYRYEKVVDGQIDNITEF